jgi:hypothetical protein
MPVGIREMNPAIPLAALRTTPLGRDFTGHLLLRHSLTQPLFRLFRRFVHSDLPQIGGPEVIETNDIAHLGSISIFVIANSCGASCVSLV